MIDQSRIRELRDIVIDMGKGWAEGSYYLPEEGEWTGADLLAVLDDYERLREELGEWRETAHEGKRLKDEWKARAEKAEAELEHRCDQRDSAIESVGLLTAELAAARPLLDAAGHPDLMMEYCPDNSEALMGLLRAALAYRESKGAGK